jgi:tRNA pseudouridine55 synthase
MGQYNGLMPVRKAIGATSHDVVNSLRRIIGAGKAGHTGTLDPSASGLLVMTLGRATKLTQFLTDWDKSYRAEIVLGAVSNTLDAAGNIQPGGIVPVMTEKEFRTFLEEHFTGRLTQKVPAYSAVKVGGRELYKYARQGVEIDSPSREIEIKSLTLVSYDPPRFTAEIRCSKGTYIRSLADDIGRELGCGAYLNALERLSVGPFSSDAALTLDEVAAEHQRGSLEKHIVPIEQALDFPVVRVRNQVRETMRHGGFPEADDILEWTGDFAPGQLISMADERGDIMAIGKSKCTAASLKATKTGDFFAYVRVLI